MIVEDVVKYVFGNINQLSENELTNRVIVTTTNKSVHEINESIIGMIEGEEKTYLSNDSVKSDYNEDNELLYDETFLNTLNPSGCPYHELKLKVNTVVMLVRNIDTSKGLCNGTRLIVKDMFKTFINLRVISGPSKGNVIQLPKMKLTPSDTRYGFQ